MPDQASPTIDTILFDFASAAFAKVVDTLGLRGRQVGEPTPFQNDQKALVGYIHAIYDLLFSTTGAEATRKILGELLQTTEAKYQDAPVYFEFLRVLPIPILGSDQVSLLSRKTLEVELALKTKEAEQAQVLLKQKEELEKSNQQLVQKEQELAVANQELEKEKEEISAEKNKLAVILGGITDGVIGLDLSRRVLTFNTAAEKMTGLHAADVIGKPIEQVFRVFDQLDELKPVEYCPLRTDGFEGVVFSQQALRLMSSNGKEVFVNMTNGQIKESTRVNLGCICTIHDVTQERQLEEMKLDFVSMAAHELRTPLTSIRGYLSVFMQENKDKFSTDQTMFLNRIEISTQQLMALIENLLNVSKIERGVFKVDIAPMDWVPFVRQTVEDTKNRAKERGLSLEFVEPLQKMPSVAADKLRIGEVINNLLSNAVAYTQSGGRIRVWVEVIGEEVVTYVQDTGEGIPAGAIPHLFTKFFRVSGKLEQGSKGTGLGLYISKKIVDMHKGKIVAESEVGRGSTFSVYLPIAKESDEKKQENIQ